MRPVLFDAVDLGGIELKRRVRLRAPGVRENIGAADGPEGARTGGPESSRHLHHLPNTSTVLSLGFYSRHPWRSPFESSLRDVRRRSYGARLVRSRRFPRIRAGSCEHLRTANVGLPARSRQHSTLSWPFIHPDRATLMLLPKFHLGAFRSIFAASFAEIGSVYPRMAPTRRNWV